MFQANIELAKEENHSTAAVYAESILGAVLIILGIVAILLLIKYRQVEIDAINALPIYLMEKFTGKKGQGRLQTVQQ